MIPRLGCLAFTLILGCTAPAFGQAKAPTADDVKTLIATFQKERTEALKSFSKEELAAADELVAKAQTAADAGNFGSAIRMIGEARWQVPFVPSGLPANVIRVLGAGRLRHGDRVNALAYSPDGTKLASASRDGTIRLWDVGNGRELLAYRGHLDVKAPVDPKEQSNVLNASGVAFSSDGSWVASCGASEIHIWDAATGKKVHTLKGPKGPFKSVAFFKDKNKLVSGGDDKKVIVWDVSEEKPLFTSDDQSLAVNQVAVAPGDKFFGSVNQTGELAVFAMAEKPRLVLNIGVSDEGRSVQSLVFTRDGAGVYTCGNDRKAKLTAGPDGMPGAGAGAVIRKFEGHTEYVNSVALSTDGKVLVTGSKDNSVIVWDAATSKILRVFQGHSKEVICVAVRPDGQQIASASDDGSIRLWPLATADEHRNFDQALDNLWTVSYSPDGTRFAVAGADRTIRVYDAVSSKVTQTLQGHKGAVTCLAFLTPNKLASASGDKTLKIWDIAAGTSKDLTGHTSAVLGVALGGKLLVSGSTDKFVRGWNPTDGAPLWSWPGKSAVCAVAVRSDGQRVAVGCASGELLILQVNEGKEPTLLGNTNAHTAGVAALSFSSNGDRVATAGGDGVVRIWKISNPNGTPVQITKFDPTIKAGTAGVTPVTAIAFSADDKFLVGGGAEGVVRIWDVSTGSEARVLRAHAGWVTSVAFAPDGRSVLSCAVDKTARLFELPRSESTVTGHTGQARCIAVSRDGKYAATGSNDKTVKVWDLATGREVANLTGNEGNVTAVVFLGSEQIAAGGEGRKLRIWNFKTGKEVKDMPAQMAVALAANEDGSRLGLAWAKDLGKDSGFDVYLAGSPNPITINGGKISSAGISSDAQWGVTGSEDGVIRIWDLVKKDRVGGDWPILKNAIADIGLTADRKTVIVIDTEGEVKVADAAKREVTATVKAMEGGVNGVMVSPTGDKFATMNTTGEVKVWDMKGKELRKWQLPFAANAAAFTIDGKKLLTANADGTAFVLEMP